VDAPEEGGGGRTGEGGIGEDDSCMAEGFTRLAPRPFRAGRLVDAREEEEEEEGEEEEEVEEEEMEETIARGEE